MKKCLMTFLLLLGFGVQADSTADNQGTGSAYATATFAGGCFWCMEPPFDKLPGVISTTSGYMGGHVDNPSYQAVSSGRTGHTEVVQIRYDPNEVSYQALLQIFWRNVDPTDSSGQFCDKGSQYRTEIFYHSGAQEKLARQSKNALLLSKPFPADIVTAITAASTFYPAEQYHQNYYLENPLRYKYYRYSCGRDARLEQLWGKQTSTPDH